MNRAGKMPAPLSGSCLNDSGSCIRARNSWEALAGSAGVSPPVCGTGTETVPETAAGTAALRLRTVRGEHRPPKNGAHRGHEPGRRDARPTKRFMES